MKKITIFICLWVGISLYSFGQINVSIKWDCQNRNSALLSIALIEVFGEDSVKQLIDKNVQISLVSLIDSLGHVSKIERVNSKQTITNDFRILLEAYLVKNKMYFYMCYTNEPSDTKESDVIDYVRDYFKTHSNQLEILSFPGELMDYYEYNKVEVKGFNLSKYDYLLTQINKYYNYWEPSR